MREYAAEFKMRACGIFADKCTDFSGRNSQTIHAAIDFEMKGEFPAGFTSARFRHSAFEGTDLIDAGNRRRQVEFENAFFFAGPKTGEEQNRLANSCFAQLDAFGGTGHAKSLDTQTREMFADFDRAEAIGIRFDDGEDLAFGADLAADQAQIVGDRGEGNLSPDRTPFELDSPVHR